MLSFRRGGNDFNPGPESDISQLVEIMISAIRDLKSMSKELKYSNWLKMIELKSKGLYDHKQMAEDFKHFGLES